MTTCRTFALALTLALSLASLDGAAQDSEKPYTIEKGLVFSKVDGTELKLDAYLPRGQKGTRPGVLVIHGGSWRGGSRRQLHGYARALAAEGMAAFAISYRLAPRFKHPAQIEDCRRAVRWLRTDGGKRFRVDPERIGAIGYSAGAHLAALLATTGMDKDKDPEKIGTRIRVAAGGGTPTDFRTLPAQLPILAYWLGKTRAQAPKVYEQASPVAQVSKDDSPFFFFHGTRDWLCPLVAAKRMHAKMKEAGIEVDMHVCEGKGHRDSAFDAIALDKAFGFLRKHLKKTPARSPKTD